MDTHCDAHLLDQHSMPQEDVGTSRPMSEASEDALSEAPLPQAAATYVPGLPAETTEKTTGFDDDQGNEPQVPGEPAFARRTGQVAELPNHARAFLPGKRGAAYHASRSPPLLT
eukprot:2069029-Amphidinium_carterae.1